MGNFTLCAAGAGGMVDTIVDKVYETNSSFNVKTDLN